MTRESIEAYTVLYGKLVKVFGRLVEQQFNLRIVDFLPVDSVIIRRRLRGMRCYL